MLSCDSCFVLLFASPADYLAERELQGKRTTVGAVDEEEEEEEAMPAAKRKPDDGGIDAATKSMSAMSVSKTSNLKVSLPYLLYSYKLRGKDYLGLDMLLISGSGVEAKVAKDGKSVAVTFELPNLFLSPTRLFAFYEGGVDEDHPKYSALDGAIQTAKEANDMEKIESTMVIEFDFKCQQRFVDIEDLDDEDATFHVVEYYQKTDGGEDVSFHIAHFDFVGANVPRQEKKKPKKKSIGKGQVQQEQQEAEGMDDAAYD